MPTETELELLRRLILECICAECGGELLVKEGQLVCCWNKEHTEVKARNEKEGERC